MAAFNYHHHQPLSPFQQTLREEEQKFYDTFPDARNAHFQDPYPQSWRHSFSDGHLPGSGFQLNAFATFHYDYSLPQAPSHSSLIQAVDPSFVGHSGIQVVRVEQNHHPAYAPPTPYASPPGVYHDPFAISAPLPSPVSTLDSQFERVHQPMSSPVMASLPSPDSSSDPSSFHGTYQPPQYYQPTPSPPHDLSAPLSPPALVQANPAVYPHPHPIPEPEHYFADRRHPLHNTTSSTAPSRRHARESSHRARRISPPYARLPSHRSGGNRGALPVSGPSTGWPPSPQNTTPTTGFTANVAGAFVNMMSGGMADQTTDTVSATSPSEIPPVSNSGKRNPDKKPALACVFCRGRKIACGPPTKDGDGKTCNQCQRRSLRCEYPAESRRGMRKKPSPSSGTPPASSTPAAGTSKAGKSDNAKAKASSNAESTSKTTTNKKR